MSGVQIILDKSMAVLWIATYTLVLIGTICYRYPSISPITQAIIAPFEFSVLIKFIVEGSFGFDYVSLVYLYWVAIEIAIMAVILILGFIERKKIIWYILLVIAITGVMCYLVGYKGYILSFSYINTFAGELFWLRFITKKDYPIKPINLALFITKFIGDIFGIIYFGKSFWLIKAVCVALPILDAIFVVIYLERKRGGIVN